MSDPKPTTPEYIAEALMKANYRLAGMGSRNERIENLYTEEGCVLVRAQAVWDALLNEGELWWRNPVLDRDYLYATEMPDFQCVLVVPLLGATRTKDTT